METMARVTCRDKEFELTEWQLHMYEKFKEQVEEKAGDDMPIDAEGIEYDYLNGLIEAQQTETAEPISIAENYFKKRGMEKFTCCICGCEFYDFTGNNPDPVVVEDNAVCCHACNQLFVIPVRLQRVQNGEPARKRGTKS